MTDNRIISSFRAEDVQGDATVTVNRHSNGYITFTTTWINKKGKARCKAVMIREAEAAAFKMAMGGDR